MGAVRARARAEWRRRWRAWLALGALLGVAGGLVTGLAAGARRTETAFARLSARAAPADVLVLATSALDAGSAIDLDEAARLPGVDRSAEVWAVYPFGGAADGRTLPSFPVAAFSGPAGPLGDTLERPLLLEGRLADPAAIDEVVVSYEAAQRRDLRVGSTLALDLTTQEGLLDAAVILLDGLPARVSGQDPSAIDMAEVAGATRHHFRVVGIASRPMDFPPVPGTLQPIVYLTPAFHEAVGRTLAGSAILIVKLEPGTSIDEYRAAVERANPGRDVNFSGARDDRAVAVQRSIDLQANGLRMLAGLVAVASLLVAGQLLARQAALESDDHRTLRALGMGQVDLLATGAVRAAIMAVLAGLVALLTAAVMSPSFPVGTAAATEPAPGFDLDALTLIVGAVLTAVVVLTFSVMAAAVRIRREARGRADNTRRSVSPASRWSWSGLPLSARLGGRLALDPGRGRAAVPVRSTIASLTVTVVAAALAITVTASLDHLTRTPRLYGWAWDAQIGGAGVPDISEPITEGLLENPDVAGFGVGTIAQVEVDGVRVDAYAIDSVRGEVPTTLLEGRAPTRPDEIVLGTGTLDDSGLEVGDRATVSTGERAETMLVVGRSVFPNFGDAGQLGHGARFTFAGLAAIAPGSLRTVALVDFRDGVDPDAAIAGLRRALDVYPVHEDLTPSDLLNFGDAGTFSTMVIGALAVVGVATLVHTLLTSIRRRRRELAVLKTLGLARGGISATIAWQAMVIAGVALAVGLPLGVAAGRMAWAWVAAQSGFPSEPVVPGLGLAGLAGTVLLLANLVALVPARFARRTPPAQILRSE